MLLVGFVPEPQDYPLFSQALAPVLGDDVDIAVLMLGASERRLFWGVLPATFSLIGYIAASFGIYRLMRPGKTSAVCLLMLLYGYTLSPLGHAGFYYVGMSAQALLKAPQEAHRLLLDQFAGFHAMLAAHWIAAVAVSAAAWLLLCIQTLRGLTRLPRAGVLFNPVPVGLAVASSCSVFPQSELAAMIGGATFNLAQAVFFCGALYCIRNDKDTLHDAGAG